MALKSKAKADSKKSRAVIRTANRSGNCNRKPSTVRPVSASFPALFQSFDAEPKGFSGFSERTGFSRS
jgi:hypothetical protein